MIGKYHQSPWTNPKTGQHHPGFPFRKASEGGNPLNDTVEIDYGTFQGFEKGQCDYTGNGRNWLMSGSCDPDPSGLPPCARARRVNAASANVQLDSSTRPTMLVAEEAEQSPSTAGQHLWSRRVNAETAGRL